MVGDLVKHIGGDNMDEGEVGPQGAVEDEVEDGEIVDEGEVIEEGEEVEEDVLKSAEDDRRDHQKVGEVQECSQKASCEKAQEAGGGGQNSSLYSGSEKEEGQLKEPKRRGQEDGGEAGLVGLGKHKKPEESIPSIGSSQRVLSEALQSSATKHKEEGKIFCNVIANDEENNVVRRSGLVEPIGKHEKGNFKKSEKWMNLQGVEKKKSAKNGDQADRFIKVVALTADKHEKIGDAAKRVEQAQDRKSVHGKPKDIATEGAGLVENLDQARVKDVKQHKEKKFASTAKDGANGVKMSTNQVLTTSSLSNGKESKEGSGVKVEGSTSKTLGAERSGGEKKGNENIVEKCVKLSESKTANKKPLKRGKHVGEVWEGFSFEKPEKVKYERPIEEGKTVKKSGKKRKAEEMSSSEKEEEKKSKKRCSGEDEKNIEAEKKNSKEEKKKIEGEKKNSKGEKKNTETEKKSNDDKKKNTEEEKKSIEKESNEDVKKGPEEETFQKKREKKYVEQNGKGKKGREETVGKKGQSERLGNKSLDTEEKRKGTGGEEKDRKKEKGLADESQEKMKKSDITSCNASKSKKTKEEEGEKHDSEPNGSGKGGREDSRSSAKKVKLDEKPKDHVGVVQEGNRDGQGDEDIKEASSKCTVEELESWKDEVNNGLMNSGCFLLEVLMCLVDLICRCWKRGQG